MRDLGTLSPKERSPSNHSPQGSGNPEEEEVARMQEPEGTPGEQVVLNQLSKAHTSSQRLKLQAQGPHMSAPGPLPISYNSQFSVLWMPESAVK